MGSLRRRLQRLEAERKGLEPTLTEEEISALSEEDVDALEDSLEHGLEQGTGVFWNLYRATAERARRAVGALIDTLDAASKGEDPPGEARDSPQGNSAYALIERMTFGDEEERWEARQECEKRNGYRIWKYYRK
jgi:hypothetical protein